MIIDFSKINLNDRPVLILRNLDGVAIKTLGMAINIVVEPSYNEVSTLTFDLPSHVEGKPVEYYNDVVGMRIVDLKDVGQFLLMDPEETDDGIRRVKSCKAYSLEYEFTKKNITLENGTYNFWNPFDGTNTDDKSTDTILGRILEKMPSWSVGYVSDSLIGKYRTFDIVEDKIYNFIKSNVQETYGCIFEFDTYNRLINVVSTADSDEDYEPKAVYLSSNRLIKKIDISEDSDGIITCLDVSGAEGVDIRNVNPTGTNKIYNLDYFMNSFNFSDDLIKKWHSWESSCEQQKQHYFNLSVERNLQTARLLTERAVLVDLQGELTSLENIRSVIVQGIAEGSKKNSDLTEINRQIAKQENVIRDKESDISAAEDKLASIKEDQVNVNKALSMESFFTNEELILLQKYFIEDSIQDDSFVPSSATTYTNEDISRKLNDTVLCVTGQEISTTEVSDIKKVCSLYGGSLIIGELSSDIVATTMEFSHDNEDSNTFVITAYLNKGKYDNEGFDSGTITATGSYSDVSIEQTKIEFTITEGNLYFTKNSSEYEQRAIEQDLYSYGIEVLNKKAFPNYSFTIDSGNFLAIQDFNYFCNELTLGKRIYLRIDDGDPLTPYLIGVSIHYDDLSKLTLEFSDTYSSSDKGFKLAQMLEQSISMGKTLNYKSGSYSSFVSSGASTQVKSFMDSALDIAKNRVLSSGSQAFDISDSGIRIRKWNDDKSGYQDEQIWIVDNVIAFTDDNWATSKMAIGKIYDENFLNADGTSGGTRYGIAAPYIVGTLLAGSNLNIGTENGSFKVDSSGVYIDSLKFNIGYTKQDDSGNDIITEKALSELMTGDGYLKASEMRGVINAQNSQMQSGRGNVLFDEDGIWLLDGATKEESTQAIWMNEKGILFGSGEAGNIGLTSGEDGYWDWTTAINHKGVIADEIAAGTLSGMDIIGGSLSIGKNSKGYNFTVDSDGNLVAESGYFRGVVQADDFENKSGISMMNNEYQFKSDYLSLYGLEILNKESDLPSLTIDDEGNIEMGTGANLIARGGTLVGSTFIAADATEAIITDSDIPGIERMVINKNGLATYNSNDAKHGIDLKTGDFSTLSFYYNGVNRGCIQSASNNITLFSNYRVHIRGEKDTLATGKWQFGNSSLPANVDFENATVTGLKITFG